MPDGAPPPGSYEHLVGRDDRTGLGDRLDALLHRHGRLVAAVVVLLALAAVGWLLAAHPWRSPDGAATPALDGVSVRVGRTDSTGTVLAGGTEPVVRIEVKVDLVAPTGTTARVRGMVGPGVVSSSTSLPPLLAGSSVVGLVTAKVRCDSVFGDDGSFAIAVDVAAPAGRGQVDGRLDRLERPWLDLLRRACAGG